MTLVVDASAMCALLLGERGARAVAEAVERDGFDLHAPHVIDLEVMSVVRRKVLTGEMSAPRADVALDDLRAWRIARHPHAPFARRVWALRANFTPYDAAYVALAEELEDCELITTDRRLARAIRQHTTVSVAAAP